MSPVVVDFGPGVMGALQRYVNPGDVSVMLSHLHADHCLDLPALLVWRRYHPHPPQGRAIVHGPADTSLRIGNASAEVGGETDDWSDTIDMRPWHDGVAVDFGGGRTVTPYRVAHPATSYGLRFVSETGRVLAYTGDSGQTPALDTIARDADVLLAEASWTHDPANRPVDIHLSGTEAGELATRAGVKELLLTHIPPWTSRDDVIAEAKESFAGPVHAVSPGETFDI